MGKYLKLIFLLLLNASNYTYNMALTGSMITKQVCQKVIPAGLALLTSYLAKFQIQDEQLFTPAELQKIKTCATKSQASILSAHIKPAIFLAPAYLEAMRIKGLNYFEASQSLSKEQIIGFWSTEFSNAAVARGLATIYLSLTKGDFVLARSVANQVRHMSPNLNLAVIRLLAAFNNDEFNNYNICTKYALDPLWHELELEQKLLIANNQELRRTMNLELALRHELLLKLQIELGLDHLNQAGLQVFLVGLMQLNPEQKFRLLLSLTPTHNLHAAFYKHNGLLKAFNKITCVHNFHLPAGLNPNQIGLLTKRMNELLFYNQDCTNSLVWSQATQALIAGLQGNIYYAHLVYSSISPTFIHDFMDEVRGIQVFMQAEQNKPKLPYDPNQNHDELQDPNDPEHKKEIVQKLAEAASYSQILIDSLNERLNNIKEIKELIIIRWLNIRHIFHGDLKPNGIPAGCHHIFGKCCFNIQKIFSLNKNIPFDVVKIIKNGVEKTSSLLPWKEEIECMQKVINIVKYGIYNGVQYQGSIVTVRFLDKVTGLDISFRINHSCLESFFPTIVNK